MRRIVFFVLLAGLAAPTAAQGTFHGNVARTGVYEGSGPKDSATVKWTFKASGPIVTSPVIADGTLYISSLGGHLYAIDPATGKEKWNFKSSRPIASTAAVVDGTVYFVSSAGSLAALDATTGKPKWVCVIEYERKFEAKGLHGYPPAEQTIPDAWDLFTSSPAVVGGKVYFGSGDGGVYAVDAESGVILWKYSTGDVVHSSPAVVNGIVYIGSWDGNLYALDAETGSEKWVFHGGQDPVTHNQVGFQSSPSVVDGTVYIGCRDAHVYAIDALTGRKKWDYPTNKSWVIGTPAVRDGLVWVGTSDSSRFMALETKTGRLRFNFDAKAYMFSSPALADDRAYVGDHNGKLYAIDTKSGKLAWEFQGEASKSDPLGVLNPDGSFNREKFAPMFGDFEDMYLAIYRYASIGAVVSSPAVDQGTVYFGGMDGRLYALH